MNKEEILNVGVCCGGRSSQKTYNNFVKMYSYAKENGFKGINITFISPELDKLQAKVNQLETNIDEAINIIKTHIGCEKTLGGILLFPTKRIIDALERGKE